MFAIAVSCQVWGEQWAGRHVLFWCDNQGDVASLLRGRSENDEIMHLMRGIALLATLHNFTFEVKWLPSRENFHADLATRVSLEDFQKECGGIFTQHVAAWLPPRSTDPDWETLLLDRILQ